MIYYDWYHDTDYNNNEYVVYVYDKDITYDNYEKTFTSKEKAVEFIKNERLQFRKTLTYSLGEL